MVERTFVGEAPPDPKNGPSSALNPLQVKLFDRLALIGPGPAAFLGDACRIMNGDVSVVGATHVVAHYLREIDSAIRAVLRPMVEEERRSEIEALKEGKHRAWILELTPLLGFSDPAAIAERWWSVSGRLHELAHRDALAQPRPIDSEFRRLWDEAQEIYDLIARQFASSYLATMPLIDALALRPAPGRNGITALRNTVPQSVVALDRFFGQLKGHAWLKPLWQETDYFTAIPPLVRGEDGSATYARWPPGQYLVRMAEVTSVRPLVIEIALALDTDNAEAHESVANAALAMPPSEAAKLVDKIGQFLASPFQWMLPTKAAELGKRLVEGGEVTPGLALMRFLLGDPGLQGNSWFVIHTLETTVVEFFPGAGMAGVELLCDTLEGVLFADYESGSEHGHDFSYVWRPSLEHERHGDSKNALVTVLRKALASLAEADRSSVPSAVTHLESRTSAIFHRLALDLLARYPEGHQVLIGERLTGETLFLDHHYRREYRQLARDHFQALSLSQQELILGWIESGPNGVDGERRELWVLRELSRLSRPLPGDWDQRYEELVRRHGEYVEGEVPDGAMFVGPTAPIRKAELAALPVHDVLQMLQDWEPERGWDKPTPEGLGRLLTEVVAQQPAEYADAAVAFADADPTYARAVIEGFRNAASGGNGFEWSPVLELARRSLDKPRLLDGRDEENWDIDSGWKLTRQQIAHLLESAFRANPPLPLNHAAEAFAILRVLAEDPDPDETNQSSAGNGMDPVTLSMNTIRGAAFHALMGYVWWVAKEREAANLEGLGIEPAVGEILERHLDRGHDSALSIRAVYGQWFPYLATVDVGWSRRHVRAIFPTMSEDAAARDVAWEAYVTLNQAYENVLELLYDEYLVSIEALGTQPVEAHFGRRDVAESVASHLMTFYGRGFIGINDPLLERFYARAPLVVRARALEFVGLGFMNAASPDMDAATRFKYLWTNRLTAFKSGATEAEELKGFAWWFSSGRFGDAWSLIQLRDLLASGGQVDPDHLVTERLAVLAESEVEEAVECLGLLVDASEKRWFVVGSASEIRTILSLGLNHGNRAGKTAREIINRLAAVGNTEFVDLL